MTDPCQCCGGPNSSTDVICDDCNNERYAVSPEGIAEYDAMHPPGSRCDSTCGWCGACS